MNYKDHCRTCLGQNKVMRHIHAVITIGGADVRLSDILKNFYDYEVSSDDQYPENLCITCVHQLTITHSFKLLIESTSKTLTDAAVSDSQCSFDYDFDDDHKITPNKLEPYHVESISKNYHINEIRRPMTRIIQRIPEKRIFCVECKQEFNTNKSLREHCNNHPVKSLTGRDCEYCSEKFENFRDLVIHRKLHLKPYLCENCWNGFYTVDEFNTHACQPKTFNRTVTSQKDMRQCDQCGKSYPPGYIKVHMMMHSDVKKYQCKYCPKRFKVPGGLNSHVLWNHKRTRNHKCEVCDATFISASARSSHIRKNHLKEKKYSCESCIKRFFSKSELQRHMLTHTGVKNFHCHLCDKSYQTRYGLNVHLKSHSNLNVNILNL